MVASETVVLHLRSKLYEWKSKLSSPLQLTSVSSATVPVASAAQSNAPTSNQLALPSMVTVEISNANAAPSPVVNFLKGLDSAAIEELKKILNHK